MDHLFEKLQRNAVEGIYPYHMPGHKRRSWGMLPKALYQMDITEIEGFDNLHQPQGLLLELQKSAAQLYGAEESFYLVNGSTSGILSAISAALPSGGHILMARNCHKSAYHAAYLRNLSITYLWPPYLREYDIFDAVTPKQVQVALEQEPDIRAVVIVSPTYEGRIADIREIVAIVHKKGIPLIVDEAHGAHLGLWQGFSSNSCQLGADLVIHSVHKTLPALTQAALLHVNGSLVDRRNLKRFLHIYQTSSPSYLLMASIDNALQYIEQEGAEAFGRFAMLYKDMRQALTECRHLKLLPWDGQKQDMGKLLVSVKGTCLTGKELYDILLHKYHLQMEMAAGSFVLAMFTINDSQEAYCRMTEALLDIDRSLGGEGENNAECAGKKILGWTLNAQGCANLNVKEATRIPVAVAWDGDVEQVALKDSVGRYAGEFINLYPPGVPLLVPGEQITEEIYKELLEDIDQGLTVQGIEEYADKACDKKYDILVLKKPYNADKTIWYES